MAPVSKAEERLATLAAEVEETARRYDRARTDAGKFDRRHELLNLAIRAMHEVHANWNLEGRKRLLRAVEYALATVKVER